MLDFTLNNQTMQSIEYSTGIPFSKIQNLDAISIDKLIEKKINKPLSLNYTDKDKRLQSRGNIFIFNKMYIKMDDIDKKLNEI